MSRLSISWLMVLILAGVSMGGIFIQEGADWKYLDDGSDQGTAWYAADFNDDIWASGPAELGFGDDDEATVLQSGFMTYYFRHKFTVADPSVLTGVVLRILRDDGAVIYLNGTEVVRSNMPDGEIDYQTRASSVVNKEKEKVFHEYPLEASSFVTGENIIAIEIHQRKITSSDISLNLSLQEGTSIGDQFGFPQPGDIRLEIAENPVKDFSSVIFSIPVSSHVTLDVFDRMGRKVYSLYDAVAVPGEHSVMLDADMLQSGVYFVRMNAGGIVETERLILAN